MGCRTRCSKANLVVPLPRTGCGCFAEISDSCAKLPFRCGNLKLKRSHRVELGLVSAKGPNILHFRRRRRSTYVTSSIPAQLPLAIRMKTLPVLLALLTPFAASSAQDTGNTAYAFCINIMPEMTRTSGLKNLDLLPDGYNISNVNGTPSVNCMYSAVAQRPTGRTSVTVYATLNLSTKKLSFEID